MTIFNSWMSAWSGMPTREISTNHERLLRFRDGDRLSSVVLPGLHVMVGGGDYLGLNQVFGAMRRADQREWLPLEYRLVLAAQVALFEKDFRRAVIDAGTAAEVALAQAISDELLQRGEPSSFIDRAVTQANGLIGLRALHLSLRLPDTPSQDALQKKLAEPRNRAAHNGAFPSEEEATVAFTFSRGLVRKVRMLPDC